MRRNLYYISIIILTLVILWSMLLPGYVMTLDMTWAPTIHFPSLILGSFANSIPVYFIFYILGIVLPSWMVQKILILSLFVLLPLISYKFLLLKSTDRIARLTAALFYTVNPFVYTRFLAGHWSHLFAYALLPAILALIKGSSLKKGLYYGLLVALIFTFSIQLGLMALLLSTVLLIQNICSRRLSQILHADVLKVVATAGLVFLVATSYWTIPYLLNSKISIVQVFDQRHMEAFKTVSDQHIGTVGNIMALYGFWGEGQPWAQHFLWVKSFPIIWSITGLILLGLMVYGLYLVFIDRNLRKRAVALIVVGFLAVVFSCGIADGPFKSINLWLFNHISIWNGFRDTQKWSALIVLVYAYFIGMGVNGIWKIPKRSLRYAGLGLSVLVIFLYTFPMLFGFWGQLNPVWYPESWKQVNEILSKDKACKALFLPWHEYYSLNFNHGLLTVSPADNYFDCKMVTSRQVELGDIGAQSLPDPAYDAVEGVVTGKDGWSHEEAVGVLRQAGIGYIILADDIRMEDPWSYDFLDAESLDVIKFANLTVYTLLP